MIGQFTTDGNCPRRSTSRCSTMGLGKKPQRLWGLKSMGWGCTPEEATSCADAWTRWRATTTRTPTTTTAAVSSNRAWDAPTTRRATTTPTPPWTTTRARTQSMDASIARATAWSMRTKTGCATALNSPVAPTLKRATTTRFTRTTQETATTQRNSSIATGTAERHGRRRNL